MYVLILKSTANDPVPVIMEQPGGYVFAPGERDQWREASPEEYSRYLEFYNQGKQ